MASNSGHKSRDLLSETCDQELSPPSTQSAASRLKESFLGLPRRLISSTSPSREEVGKNLHEIELVEIGGSQWLVIEAKDSPDMSSSVEATAQDNPNLTPNSFRKRTHTGNKSTPPLGPRSTSGKSKLVPSSPHSTGTGPFQRKPSGRGSRSTNLEVQNGDPLKRSGSPSRVRNTSPPRGSGRTSSPNNSSMRSKKKGILLNDSENSVASNHVVTSPQSESRPSLHSNIHQATAAQANEKSLQRTPATLSAQASGKESPKPPISQEEGEASTSAFEKVRDTLRISRPKKKKKAKGKLAYSIVVDPSQMSTPEINLHDPGKYQDPFETSFAENGDMEKKMDHVFKPASIPHNKPEYCDHCGDMAWGLYRQVLKCSSKFLACWPLSI